MAALTHRDVLCLPEDERTDSRCMFPDRPLGKYRARWGRWIGRPFSLAEKRCFIHGKGCKELRRKR